MSKDDYISIKTHEKDYIWTVLAGLVNASEAIIMSMIATRIGTVEDAGILSISFAVGNLFMSIGKFGIRPFHSTDVEREFRFATYLKARVVSCFLMFASLMVYIAMAITKNYNMDKIIAIVSITAIYLVEALEDCVWGELQRRDYLYVGAKMFVIRWAGILVTYVVGIFITGSQSTTLLICLAVSVIIFSVMCFGCRKKYAYDIPLKSISKKNAKEVNTVALLKQSFSLFASSFALFYICNSAKYAINDMLSDYVQACYGFIAMPIFVIGLLNQFIYQPQLVRLATNLKEGMFTLFRRMIKRQLIIVLGLSVVCMAGAAVLGIPVLSWLYNTDLKDYFGELVILQVAGMFLAISGYLNIVLVTMRKQKSVLVCYLIFMIIAGIAMRPTVRIYGTMGAAIAYVFLLALMCVAFGVLYKIYLNGIIRESGVVNSDEDSGNSVTMLRRKG